VVDAWNERYGAEFNATSWALVLDGGDEVPLRLDAPPPVRCGVVRCARAVQHGALWGWALRACALAA
jgi:hypothetical protein